MPSEIEELLRRVAELEAERNALLNRQDRKNSTETRFRELAEQVSDVLFQLDDSGAFVYVSPAASTLAGYDPLEVVGKSFADFIYPEDLPFLLKRFQEVLGGEAGESEYRIRTKSGRHRWVRSFSRPIVESGRILGLHGVLSDINDRKNAEFALTQSDARFRKLVENATFGFFICEWPSGKPLYFNQKLLDLGDCKLEDLTDNIFRDFLPPKIKKIMDGTPAPGEHSPIDAIPDSYVATFTVKSKSGRNFRAETSVMVIEWEGRLALQIICQDVTEREMLQQQLQHAQKMEAIGTLAGGVAHEFNNILMAISGYSQILSFSKDLPPEVMDILGKIDKATLRAAGLTRKMLTLSRMEAGEKKSVDINLMLEGIRELIDQTFPKEIEIKTVLAPEPPPLWADPNQMEQILLNLAVNARDAMPDGGKLTFRARPMDLHEEFVTANPWARPGPWLELMVEDSGSGIPKSVLNRIFEPFYTTKDPGQGTGLGLSVVYSLIKNHNGGILVDSTIGRGTRFKVFLPLMDKYRNEGVGRKKDKVLPRGNGETILVVDDEAAVRDITQKILKSFNYSVTGVSEGQTALSVYSEAMKNSSPFDLVIMDLSMPVMDGRKAIESLLQMDPDARIVIATGENKDKEQIRNLFPRVQGILQKPFELAVLIKETYRIINGLAV